MKCPKCHCHFDPSDDERSRAIERGRARGKSKVSYVESYLPKYCSWECLKEARGLKFRNGSKREKLEMAKNRYLYHIGPAEAKPGSPEARIQECAYRKRMAESVRRKPPRFADSGFAHVASTVTSLPSESIMGPARRRVLDECATHLGGEDGENFNFEGE
jgi:hypothetical protein